MFSKEFDGQFERILAQTDNMAFTWARVVENAKNLINWSLSRPEEVKIWGKLEDR